MKKPKIVLSLLSIMVITSACGSSYDSYRMTEGNSIAMNSMAESAMYTMNSTGGDYSTTSITGDFADYSYRFSARGVVDKSRQDMLDYFETVQTLVDDNNGYIENVDNNYTSYIISPDDSYISSTAINYDYEGNLCFNVQIPNDNIEIVTNNLEEFCKNNGFIVTQFDQTITNYKYYNIVDDYDDNYQYKTITKDELNKKLKYANLDISINYRHKRSSTQRFALSLKEQWEDFWDGIGQVIQAFILIGVGLIILFIEFVIFYKLFKRMRYKHMKKKPEYYEPKHVVIDKQE